MPALTTGQAIILICGHPRTVMFNDAHDTSAKFWCGECDGMRAVRPRDREWIPTAEVRVDDQLAHKLSDTPWTYTTVTGWSDKHLTVCDVTHRTFAVTGAPWWVRADNFELVADLAGMTLIKRRESAPGIHNEGRPVTPEWEQGYAAGMQDGADSVINYRPYRNPDSDWQRGYNDAYRTLNPA